MHWPRPRCPSPLQHQLMDSGLPSDSKLPVAASAFEGPDELPSEAMTVPDGGLRAWTTIAGAWLVLFGTFGYIYSFGVFEEYYALVYLTNHTPSSIAWIGSFQLMSPFALGIVSGQLLDAGHFHSTEIFGDISQVFMNPQLVSFYPFSLRFSQGLGMGLGLGFTFIPTVAVCSHYFSKRRGLASGIALSGLALGATIFPISDHLLPKIGFGPAVRSTGYVVLAAIIPGNMLMRARLPPRSQRPGAVAPNIGSFFTDAPYMWSIAGLALASIGVTFPLIYIQLFATQHSVGSSIAFYSIAIMNGSSAVGRIVGTHLADVYGPFNVQIGCTMSTGALVWAVLGIHNTWTLVLVSALYGILSGLALAVACLASQAKSPSEVGARTGVAMALASLGFLTSSPIQGALLTENFLWIRPTAFAGSLMFAGSLVLVWARLLRTRRVSSHRV
ncbi:MFS general substrate transporter [Roridomyces roridus]|uniref:MFS general substrate transporter n=1 Tax=Roridomyces roridus TaxID=1738132 RepID=A0AAD7BR05_9AGAR|nr:MFS general substrate transporter [Roridomyces roridus]